jgi:hypothetical protein
MTDEEPRGSFVRWQAITIGQLTYAINLVMGLSVATLGFQVALLLGDNFTPTGLQKCAFVLSLFALMISVVFGVVVVINRLRSFRETMRTARAREKAKEAAIIEGHRQLYRKLDKRTWWLFWWQVGAFASGVVLTTLSVLAFAGQKLL